MQIGSLISEPIYTSRISGAIVLKLVLHVFRRDDQPRVFSSCAFCIVWVYVAPNSADR